MTVDEECNDECFTCKCGRRWGFKMGYGRIKDFKLFWEP